MLQLTTKNDKGIVDEELEIEELTLSMEDPDSSKGTYILLLSFIKIFIYIISVLISI